MTSTDLRSRPSSNLGLRNLALGIDAPRFRHLGQAVRDGLMWFAVLLLIVCALPFVSAWLRALMIGGTL